MMSSPASTDHFSVGASAGVDLSVLQSSVSVHYDKATMENRDSKKASVTTSCRAGTVAFVRPPELSADAFGVLHRQSIDAFHAIYGDYYIGGYRIGGDTLVLFSADASSRSESETKRVNIDVESWFGDYHEQSATTSSSMEHSTVVQLLTRRLSKLSSQRRYRWTHPSYKPQSAKVEGSPNAHGDWMTLWPRFYRKLV